MSEKSAIDFGQLIDDNKNRIYRICRVYAVSPFEPEDLFQDVVCELWKSIHSFRGDSNVSTWVYRIALNVCGRAKQKHESHNRRLVRLDNIHFENIPDTRIQPEDERFEDLRHCIGKLDEADRALIVLHLDELPYKQISDITGLTENTIAVKLKRIRAKLLDCMLSRQNH